MCTNVGSRMSSIGWGEPEIHFVKLKVNKLIFVKLLVEMETKEKTWLAFILTLPLKLHHARFSSFPSKWMKKGL